MFEEGRIDIIKLGGEGAKSSGVGQSVVTNVAIVSDQLVIDGANLDGVTKVRITGPSGFDQTFAIESQSASNLVANGLSNIAFAVGSVFDLILTDAQGAATHQVTFTLQDGAVTASKLDDMGAGVGQVLKYDGTTWGPSDLGALTYAGTWDASSATVPNVSPSAGEYYIVSVAGTGIDLSDGSGSRNFAVGDWLVYNNTTSRWDKIDNATSVTSFNGRNGPITPATNDYTWAQIDKTTSPIGDLSNVNTTGAGVGSVLKFDGTNWVVGTDDTVGAGSVDSSAITDGSIVDADVNASAAIAQSKINNLTTDLAAKLNLSGGTMTGDLTMGSNNIITSGTVDGVDVSALNTTVGNNSTAIAGKQNTITTGTTAQYLRGDLSLSTFATDARSAAVLNSTAGTETDQAASVAAMKTYVSSQVSGSGSVLDGGNTTGATVVVGTNDAQSLQFETNNTPAMTILNGGNVGIGTTSPSTPLHVVGFTTLEQDDNSATAHEIDFYKSRGGAIVQDNDYLGVLDFRGSDGVTDIRGAYIAARVNGTPGTNDMPTELAFATTIDGNSTSSIRMLIDNAGNVGIGTTAPATKLDVEGKITVGPIDATAGNTGAITLEELAANGTNSVTFRAPDSIAANYTLTMPADDGSSGQVLSTDGSGVLSWAAAPAATSVSASSGSAATPSMSFSSDPNTGLFSGGADVISFSAGGSEIFSASSSGLVSPTTGGASVSTANGTASAPTFSFAGDTDTGWFRPAANTLAAATAGSERVRIDASGNVGIGTTNPSAKLELGGETTLYPNALLIAPSGHATSERASLTLDNWQIMQDINGDGTKNFSIWDGDDSSHRFVISESGNIGVGTTGPSVKMHIVSDITEPALFNRYVGTNSWGTHIRLRSARGTSTSPAAKQASDVVAFLDMEAWDGDEYVSSAQIISRIDGTPGNNDMPGNLTFSTTPDGGNSTIERMRIGSDGNVGIGTTNPERELHVMGNIRAAGTVSYFGRHADTGNPSRLAFQRSRGSYDSPTALTDGDGIGDISFSGYRNGSYQTPGNSSGARIAAEVDGTPSGDSLPTTLIFRTTASGDTTNSERMRIAPNGNVGIGTANPATNVHIFKAGANALQVPLRVQNSNGVDSGGSATGIGFNVSTSAGSKSVIAHERTNTHGRGKIHFLVDNTGDNSDADLADSKMVVDRTGNVGIGTTNPSNPLHIVSGDPDINLDFSASPTADRSEIRFSNNGSLKARIEFDRNSEDFIINSDVDSNGNGDIILSGDNVGIGTDNPSYKLHVVGSAGKTTGSSWTSISDRRLKDIQGDYEYGLEEIMQLNTVRFNYSEGNELGLPSENKIVGFVAQEVQAVIPDAVHLREDGFLELNVDPIHWALVNATQEQQTIIESNLKMMETMKNGIESNSRRIAALEQENKEIKAENQEIKKQLQDIKSLVCSMRPDSTICLQ